MLIEQQVKQYRALNKWFKSSLGHFVAHEFAVDLESAHDYLKGETLLQLGSCGENFWLKQLKFDKKWIATPYPLAHKAHFESELDHLPLTRNSIDCVIAPLTLEPFHMSAALIDEIDRVLRPMGFVVFLCINPWSLWGAALKSGLMNCYHDRQIKLCPPFILNRMLLQRGYIQRTLTNFCYIPPVQSVSMINKLTFLDDIGKMLWPVPSGFYCYIAQKHQIIQPSLIHHSMLQPISDYQSPLQPATFR